MTSCQSQTLKHLTFVYVYIQLSFDIMRKIAKVVQKFNIYQQPKEYHFWLTQSYTARIQAVEEIVREHHRWQVGNEPRLQRVYSIAQRA